MSHYKGNQAPPHKGVVHMGGIRADYVDSFASLSIANKDNVLHRILLPLFFQNKFAELDVYMQANPETPNLLVAFLDKYCAEDSDFTQLAETIPNIQKSRLTVNAMNKAVIRLIKKFNVPKQHWPNVSRKQIVGTFYFLAQQFYEAHTITDEDFVDLLIEKAGSDRKSQGELVNIIRRYDVKGAAWFVLRFRWPSNEIPLQLSIIINEGTAEKPHSNYADTTRQPTAKCYWFEPIDYEHWKSGASSCGLKEYQPVLPSSVRHVNDPEIFVQEMTKISKNTNIMAIDCEWKPTFASFPPPSLSILQVATEYVVLIVDVLQMGPKMRQADWHVFVELMCDEHMLKLGFNFRNDYAALANAHEYLKDIATITANMLDLQDLCRGMLKEMPTLFPYYYNGHTCSNQGLSTFTELCLGVTLNKREQFSNWDRRPLRESQKTYAASDVHCLIDMYRILQTKGREKGIFDLKRFKASAANASGGHGDQD